MCSQDANTAFELHQRGKKTSIFAASRVAAAQTTPDLDARARQSFHCSLLKKNQINQRTKLLMCEEVPIKCVLLACPLLNRLGRSDKAQSPELCAAGISRSAACGRNEL